MPIDYAHYPPNWLTEIRPRILVRAGERRDADGEIIREAHCEKCASPNHGVVYRWAGNYMLFDGATYNDETGDFVCMTRGSEMPFETYPVKIVLTIAHFDHDETNNADENLRAWCQKCHLTHDAKQHAATARRMREAKSGQLQLIEGENNERT